MGIMNVLPHASMHCSAESAVEHTQAGTRHAWGSKRLRPQRARFLTCTACTAVLSHVLHIYCLYCRRCCTRRCVDASRRRTRVYRCGNTASTTTAAHGRGSSTRWVLRLRQYKRHAERWVRHVAVQCQVGAVQCRGQKVLMLLGDAVARTT